MNLNSSFLRSAASGEAVLLFKLGSGHAAQGVKHARTHFGGFGRAADTAPSGPVRDAMRAIFDALAKPGGTTSAFTGIRGSGGDDVITQTISGPSLIARAYIDAGGGDDTVNFASTAEGSVRIRGGAGDDTITAAARTIRGISGGSGDDALGVSGRYVRWVNGGSGDDGIAVAGEYIRSVRGGSGDDAIAVAGERIRSVRGGSGDDTISVAGERVGRVYGGSGDDVISVTAGHASRIDGGSGNDTISLSGEGRVVMRAGGGQDVVMISDRTEFSFGKGLSLDDASFSFENGTMTVSFEGRNETLTIATGGDFKLEMNGDRGFVLTPG